MNSKTLFFSAMVFFILILFFSGCNGYFDNFEQTIGGVAQKTSREINKKFPFLTIFGLGGSLSKDNIIIHETLIFSVDKIITKDEATILISRVIDTYLSNLYKEKKLKKYLENHPFNYKNLELGLIVYDKRGNTPLHPDIAGIDLSNGKISYLTVVLSEKWFYEDESYCEESFQEAAKRLGVWKDQFQTMTEKEMSFLEK